ncbi:hypothetical protein BS47DRAFT_1319292 [Hydnum rufescens UP504]|uniref:Capsular associated protein n=1 Tax=Hydnum rufescens UP504 TaxID=1448309 RepID=A0A9P6DTX8_9AGAM|nr:hypothetical protein BS47DRAFT_1319292 [Hydnum rufescens UP504]
MQRRANIRPPSQQSSSRMDTRSSPLRTSKSLRPSLTPRITIFLLIVFVIFLFTRLTLFPDSPSTFPYGSRNGFISRNLVARNYLNVSAHDPAPFSFCPIYGPGDELAKLYTASSLHKSNLHRGSSARVQQVINKALRGQPVTISVLGGSVTACHGAGDEPLSPSCYPAQFFDWWNTVFPHPASELTNGARRRTDSSYFSYCNSHHLPDKTDLVILEFDTDDQQDEAWMGHFELLVRSILIRPEQPAVIILGHFSPQLQGIHGYAGPEQLHTSVAQFYDVPHISAKGLLYNGYLHNPSLLREKYYTDPVLANPGGHRILADVLIHYFQEQICTGWSAIRGYTFDVPVPGYPSDSNAVVADSEGLFRGMDARKGETNEVDDTKVMKKKKKPSAADSRPAVSLHVPPYLLSTRPFIDGGSDPYIFQEVHPFCVSANDLINPLPSSLFFGSGWHIQKPQNSIADSMTPSDAYYWYATYPTSKLRVPVTISGGNVVIWYLSQDPDALVSEISCWVDNNYKGAVTIGGVRSGPPTPMIQVIDSNVASGSHYIECQLLGEEGVQVPSFKILGIFTS